MWRGKKTLPAAKLKDKKNISKVWTAIGKVVLLICIGTIIIMLWIGMSWRLTQCNTHATNIITLDTNAYNNNIINNTDIESLNEKIKYLSRFHNYNMHKIHPVTSDEDYNWCESILDYYENHTNNRNNRILYEKYFTYRESNGHPIWRNRRVDHTFTSQHHQDWFLYSAMFVNMISNGFYIDLAANSHRMISNTFFFDKCLSWNGLCIEPQLLYHEKLLKYRNCELITNCVWNETKKMIFESNPKYFPWGSGVKGYNTIHKYIAGKQLQETIELEIICKTIQDITNEYGIKHIDYLSLDVEGAEFNVLQGINWNKIQIDVITVEQNENQFNIKKYLIEHGFVPKITLFEDIVFVHKNAKQKIKWIDEWLSNVQWNGIHGLQNVSFH